MARMIAGTLLAAIGAGGVLRDIQAAHGALRLTELVRFTDRDSGIAYLAVRDGNADAFVVDVANRGVPVVLETPTGR